MCVPIEDFGARYSCDKTELIEVFKILRGFENLDPDRFSKVIGDGVRIEGAQFKTVQEEVALSFSLVWTRGSLFAGRVCGDRVGQAESECF